MPTTGQKFANFGYNTPAVGITPWANPTNVYSTNGTVASCVSAGSSQHLTATQFDFSSIPEFASITLIDVYFVARNVGGGTTLVNVQVQDDGNNLVGASSNIAVSGSTLTAYNLGWTGLGLSRAQVQSANFGAQIWFNTGDNIEVDSVSIDITYSVPARSSQEVPTRPKQRGSFEVIQSLVLSTLAVAAINTVFRNPVEVRIPKRQPPVQVEVVPNLAIRNSPATSAAPFVTCDTSIPLRARKVTQVEPPSNIALWIPVQPGVVFRGPLELRPIPRRLVQADSVGVLPAVPRALPFFSQTDQQRIFARRLDASAFADSSATPLVLLPALIPQAPAWPVDMQNPLLRIRMVPAESQGQFPPLVPPLRAPFPPVVDQLPVRTPRALQPIYHRPSFDAAAPVVLAPLHNEEFPAPRLRAKVTQSDSVGRLPSSIPPATAGPLPFAPLDFPNPRYRIRTLQPQYFRPAPDAVPLTPLPVSSYDWPTPRAPRAAPPFFLSDGSVTIKACPMPDPGWQAVFIEAPNYTSSYAIQSVPPLTAGCTVYWGNIQGTGAVSVWLDGTFSADYTVVSFDVKICKDGIVGQTTTQVVNPPLFKVTDWDPPKRKSTPVIGDVQSARPDSITPLPLPPPPVDMTNPRPQVKVTYSVCIGVVPDTIPPAYKPFFTADYTVVPRRQFVQVAHVEQGLIDLSAAAPLPSIPPFYTYIARKKVITYAESYGPPPDTIPRYPDPLVQRDWPNPIRRIRTVHYQHDYPPFLVPPPVQQDITIQLTGFRINLRQGALLPEVIKTMSRLDMQPKLQGATEYLLQPFNFAAKMGPVETILSYTFMVSVYSGVDANPSALLAGTTQTTRTTVSPLLTGGTVGTIYELLCEVVTDGGQILQQVGYVYVEPHLP